MAMYIYYITTVKLFTRGIRRGSVVPSVVKWYSLPSNEWNEFEVLRNRTDHLVYLANSKLFQVCIHHV